MTIKSLAAVCAALAYGVLLRAAPTAFPVGGTWSVTLEGSDAPASVTLPGTLGDAGLGPAAEKAVYGALTPRHQYVGKAVYTRTVEVTPEMSGPYELFLERVMWQSEAFWDGVALGSCDSLAAPHVYRIPESAMTPGTHTLTVTVDNSLIHPIGEKSHSYGDAMQTRWNGMIGRLELRPVNPLRAARVFAPCGDTFTVELPDGLTATARVPGEEAEILTSEPGRLTVRIPGARPWDEFDPQLYTVELTSGPYTHSIRFGFRTLETDGRRVLLNGRPLFLRGNTENCHFPLTGYPAMDKAAWLDIFGRLKAEGVNQIRCHTWAVPQAAYDAADELGLLVSPEVVWIDGWMTRDFPYLKGIGRGPKAVDEFVRRELFRILDAYGNAPSFFSLSVGNELGSSDFDLLGRWMKACKAYDGRHLYAASSARAISPGDEFFITHSYPGVGMVRERRREGTDWDYEDVYGRTRLPTVAHEIGQWPVWPDYARELPKYTGLLRPWNLEILRDAAADAGVLRYSAAFARASLRTNLLMYKDEIESFMRTPSCAGLQLLGVQDYSGQGEALIGWFDSFYDRKPGAEDTVPVPVFFAPTVPLARFAKYVWTADETFEAKLVVHNYGREAFRTPLTWSFAGKTGTVSPDVPVGAVRTVGTVRVPLADVKAPARLELTFGENRWPVWVYPADIDESVPDNVLLTDRLDVARRALAEGRRVVLNACGLVNPKTRIASSFWPVYWSRTWFPGQLPWTLGMLIRDDSPAFASFPTEDWQDWQWKHIIGNAETFTFASAPEGFEPLAMPIVDFHRPTLAAILFETRVGAGRLLVSGVNLAAPRPEIRQLRRSLLDYAASADFDPQTDFGEDFFATYFLEETAEYAPRPEAYRAAVAYIECAAGLREKNRDMPWMARRDRAELLSGSYTLGGKAVRTWADADGTYWVGDELRIVFTGAANIRGRILVRFRDPNALGRRAEGSFDGGRTFAVPVHAKGPDNPDGSYWLELPVDMEDFLDGELVFTVRKTAGPNIMIDRVILMPNEP